MNVIDRLKSKATERGATLTTLEKLVLQCPNKDVQLMAAAELYELQQGRTSGDPKDLTELTTRQV